MSFQPSIHSLKTGQYQLSYLLPQSKQRRRLRFSSYQEAIEAQKVVELRHDPNKRSEFASHTIKDLMALHLKECPHSKVEDRKVAFKLFMEKFSKEKLHKLNKVALERWLDEVVKERDISLRTLHQWVFQLNQFFDYLVDQEMLLSSPLRMVKLPSQTSIPMRRPRVVLSQEEVREILEVSKYCSPTYFYPLFLLLAHTGARRGELLNLKWDAVDLKMETIAFRNTKNGSDRVIRIAPGALEWLRKAPRRSPYGSPVKMVFPWA